MPSVALTNPLVDMPVTIVADNTQQVVYLTGCGYISNGGSNDCEVAVSNNSVDPVCSSPGEQKVGQITLKPNMTIPILMSWKSLAYKSASGTKLSYVPSKG